MSTKIKEGYKYDYLLVGAGLFNAIFANEALKHGKSCIVVEKRNHIGGNLYCENLENINVHKYGPHIFHTKDKCIWDYIRTFCDFNNFIYSPLAYYKDNLYNLPLNMNTFYQMWKTKSPIEARTIIKNQILDIKDHSNLEDYILSVVGKDIYYKLIKGYTEKQWGVSARELPAFIVKRIPLRFIFDNNYFDDPYQGIPIGGYNQIFDKCFAGCKIIHNTDFNDNKYLREKANTTIYTGMIDSFFNFCYGALEYRSLSFETEILKMENYQGNATVNYTDKEIPFTRIIEHKHFEFGKQPNTVITKEFPQRWVVGMESFYPINTSTNQNVYERYKILALKEKNLFFAGRLGEYKYYNMDQIISSALELFRSINN